MKRTGKQQTAAVKERAEAAVSRAGHALREGAVKTQVRVERAMERARLQRKSRELETAIQSQLRNVGALIYATHCGDPTDSADVQRILEYIDQLRKELSLVEESLRSV